MVDWTDSSPLWAAKIVTDMFGKKSFILVCIRFTFYQYFYSFIIHIFIVWVKQIAFFFFFFLPLLIKHVWGLWFLVIYLFIYLEVVKASYSSSKASMIFLWHIVFISQKQRILPSKSTLIFLVTSFWIMLYW